jgi:predicted nucleotidyltransferase
MYYEEVFKALEENKVRYLVVGGVALVLHGVVRLTGDLDLMIDLETANVELFLKTMTLIGYKPKLPVKAAEFADPQKRASWITEKSMKVFPFIHEKDDYKIIDVFPENPIPFSKAYGDRQKITAGKLNIAVISFDDLIALKTLSGREQDKKDIEMLREIKKK